MLFLGLPALMPQLLLVPPDPPWLFRALEALARYRLLTARQLAVCLDVSVTEVASRLPVLEKRGMVQSLSAPAMRETVLCLTRTSARLLAVYKGSVPVLLPHRTRSLFTLAHEVGVSEAGIVLERLSALGHFTLERYETAREKIAASTVLRRGKRSLRVPLVADAFAVLRTEQGFQAFLIEIDRNTASLSKARVKIAAYHAWWAEGGPEKRFGMRALRVLYIVPHETRAERLREAALQETGGSGLFWFACASDVRAEAPEAFLQGIWRQARNESCEAAQLFSS